MSHLAKASKVDKDRIFSTDRKYERVQSKFTIVTSTISAKQTHTDATCMNQEVKEGSLDRQGVGIRG